MSNTIAMQTRTAVISIVAGFMLGASGVATAASLGTSAPTKAPTAAAKHKTEPIIQALWWQRRDCSPHGPTVNCINVRPQSWKGLVYRYRAPDGTRCNMYTDPAVAKEYDHCWGGHHG